MARRVRRHVVADAEVQVAVGVEVQAGATHVARAGVDRTAREARGAPVGRRGGRGGRAADLHLGHAQDHALGARDDGLAVGGQGPAHDLVVAEHLARRVRCRVGQLSPGPGRGETYANTLRLFGSARSKPGCSEKPRTPSSELPWSARVGMTATVVLLPGRAVLIMHHDRALRLVVVGRGAGEAGLGPVDLAVLGGVDADRLVGVGHEHGPLEARPHGARAVGLLALTGDPADAADHHVDHVVVAAVLGVAHTEVAHAGVPRAAVGVASSASTCRR